MAVKLGVLMDPIQTVKTYKDTTFAVLLEATYAGIEIYYMEQPDLYLQDGQVQANLQRLHVVDDMHDWFSFEPAENTAITDLDCIFMRKDPPFDMEYIYTTYLLELAMNAGVRVVNNPQSLRDANEKLYTAWFPQCCPPILVTRDTDRIKHFLHTEKDIIIKPLDGMAGRSIFRLSQNDHNINVILETITQNNTQTIMAQTYIPEIVKGDKRILLINGKPIPHALARIPATGETRANLATGGTGAVQPLSKRDHWICQQVGPTLKSKGIIFAGIDVIGDYLTEINITSPTCVREIEKDIDINVSKILLDAIIGK